MYVMLSGHSSPIPFLFVCCFSLVPCFSVVHFFLLLCPLFGSFSFVSFDLSSLFCWWFCCSPLSACAACCCVLLSRSCVGATGQCIGSFPFAWLHPPPIFSSLFVPFLSTSSSCFLVLGRHLCWRIATSCSCFGFFFSLLAVLCAYVVGGVLAGWLCCVGVVYVFSLCSLLRRRKVLPPM